jgi:hypothetical protein
VIFPVLITTSILAKVVLTRGGTGQGILLILTSIFIVPVFVFCAPFLSSLFGLAGIGAAEQRKQKNAAQQRENSHISTDTLSSEKKFSKLILGRWRSDNIEVEYLDNGTFFYHGSGETTSKVGFDPDTGVTRPTRWRIAGDRLIQDSLSPRRTQRGMEFLLIKGGFTATVILLSDSELVIRAAQTGKEFHFVRF